MYVTVVLAIFHITSRYFYIHVIREKKRRRKRACVRERLKVSLASVVVFMQLHPANPPPPEVSEARKK